MKSMGAADFKARCLAVLDEVSITGEPVVVTKHGKPVAQVVPVQQEHDSETLLLGSVTVLGDIVGPVVDPLEWEANRGDWEPKKG